LIYRSWSRSIADAPHRCLSHHTSFICPRFLHALSRHIHIFCYGRWLAHVELYSQGMSSAYHTLNHANCCQIFYTLSSLYIIFLMTSVYARTREREKAWKFGLYCLAGAIVVAPFWFLIFKTWVIRHNTFMGVCTLTLHLQQDTDPSSCYGFSLRFSNPSA
jgi:hypothetical protein